MAGSSGRMVTDFDVGAGKLKSCFRQAGPIAIRLLGQTSAMAPQQFNQFWGQEEGSA
ncbi:MAG TPA: hypothetical protein VI094_16385 [Propionibacteriaceae bacterium]